MRIIPALLVMLFLTGCASSSPVTMPMSIGEPQSFTASPGRAVLSLKGTELDGQHAIELEAREAEDLYQIAGSIAFNASKYQISAVLPGGGFGESESVYFAYSQREPGMLDFGYTKRYRGPGISGSALLLRIELEPVAELDTTEFILLQGEGQLVVRDSRKHDLDVSVLEGGQQ